MSFQGIFSTPDLIRICVDGRRNSDIYGRIYSSGRILSRFSSAAQMLDRIEAFCDTLGYPQSSVKMRTFKDTENKSIMEGETREMEELKDFLSHRGEEATFVVRVQYRQNATWQGQVTWAEKKQTMAFRSALELLKLMDSAFDEKEEMEGIG